MSTKPVFKKIPTTGGQYWLKPNIKRSVVRRRPVQRGYPTGTRGELKAVDVSIAQVNDSTGAVTLLNGIARGDDINERDGRQVTAKQLELRLYRYVTSGTGIDQLTRVLVVLDRQANAAAPAITDVLVSASPYALQNLDNRKRFLILWDDLRHLNATAEADSACTNVKRISLKFQMQFNNGNAGTVADITTNALYLITVGNVAAGATAGAVAGRTRFRFTDQ